MHAQMHHGLCMENKKREGREQAKDEKREKERGGRDPPCYSDKDKKTERERDVKVEAGCD